MSLETPQEINGRSKAEHIYLRRICFADVKAHGFRSDRGGSSHAREKRPSRTSLSFSLIYTSLEEPRFPPSFQPNG